MDMGEKIKARRMELNMTQEELAEKLSVSRAAVSNWETGRNYPDLQMIVLTADVLNLSLDEMLREDCEMIQKITNDTKCRKLQSRKIKGLRAVIFILIIGIACLYCMSKTWEINKPHQIVSAKRTGDTVEITVDVPKFMSVAGYLMGSDIDGNEKAAEISIMTSVDLSMKNVEKMTIELDDDFQDIDTLLFVSRGEEYKTVNLE